jgi:hypothetical protein
MLSILRFMNMSGCCGIEYPVGYDECNPYGVSGGAQLDRHPLRRTGMRRCGMRISILPRLAERRFVTALVSYGSHASPSPVPSPATSAEKRPRPGTLLTLATILGADDRTLGESNTVRTDARTGRTVHSVGDAPRLIRLSAIVSRPRLRQPGGAR